MIFQDFFGYKNIGNVCKIIINRDNRIQLPDPVFGTFEVKQDYLPDWAENRFNVILPGLFKNKTDGQIIASFEAGSQKYPVIIQKQNCLIFNFDPEETLKFLNNENYLQTMKSKSILAKSPISTNLIPEKVKTCLRNIMTTPWVTKILKKNIFRSKYPFPKWPIEKSGDTIRFIILRCLESVTGNNIETTPFWPDGKKFAVALTHDVDTDWLFRNNNYRAIADIENKYGIKSAWLFVSNTYEFDTRIMEKLRKNGHEIGFHSDNHDSKFAFLDQAEMDRRLNNSSWFFDKYNVKGFRSPAFLHTYKMYKGLSRYISYDCSYWDTCDTIENTGSNNSGSCTVFPFNIENVVILPTTIPQDWVCSSLVGKNHKKILQMQLDKYQYIKKVNGLVCVLTHPEPGLSVQPEFLKAYDGFLREISNDKDAYLAPPYKIADWWNTRIHKS
ncbi:MAG: polysaccharide deacetylase family protein [Elusimicrobia bacterium]|nr:polysaccharide deacetylase family protein [Elusimicrobiota bacterium]